MVFFALRLALVYIKQYTKSTTTVIGIEENIVNKGSLLNVMMLNQIRNSTTLDALTDSKFALAMKCPKMMIHLKLSSNYAHSYKFISLQTALHHCFWLELEALGIFLLRFIKATNGLSNSFRISLLHHCSLHALNSVKKSLSRGTVNSFWTKRLNSRNYYDPTSNWPTRMTKNNFCAYFLKEHINPNFDPTHWFPIRIYFL